MQKFSIGDKIRTSSQSIHHGYTGTVVNADGDFLTVQEDSTKPNPKAYKSGLYEGFKVFQLDKRFTYKMKDPK